jgi:hypothetical protein
MSGLLAFSSTTLVILNQPPYEVVLSGHEAILLGEHLLDADWRRWWWWSVAMWNLTTSGRSLRDVKVQFLDCPCTHHLSY